MYISYATQDSLVFTPCIMLYLSTNTEIFSIELQTKMYNDVMSEDKFLIRGENGIMGSYETDMLLNIFNCFSFKLVQYI